MKFPNKPATEAQVRFIKSLVTDRLAVISALPDAERANLLVPPTTMWEASQLITRLKGLARDTAQAPVEPVDEGLYLVEGVIVKVYRTQNGFLAGKRLVVLGNGRGSFEYERGLVRLVRAEHRLTEEQAREFGKTHAFCCACAKTLNDDRSIAVGYGAECARNHGWHYPTKTEATELLGRPITNPVSA